MMINEIDNYPINIMNTNSNFRLCHSGSNRICCESVELIEKSKLIKWLENQQQKKGEEEENLLKTVIQFIVCSFLSGYARANASILLI